VTLFILRHARTQRPPQLPASTRKDGRKGRGLPSKREAVLSAEGWAQARALVESVDGERIARLVSSPSTRCRETLEPLAARRGLRIDVDPRLGDDASPKQLNDLLSEISREDVLVCSHGDTIPQLLARLGVPSEYIRCAKASLWRIENDKGRPSASYDPPPPPRSEVGTRLAALDLGSTSFHLLVADVYDDGRLERVKRKRRMLRLGALLAEPSELPAEAIVRVCDTAADLRDTAWTAGALSLLCVATAAFRDGARGRQLASDLGARLRAPIRVMSGEEEAHAIFAAFRRRLDLGPEPVLGIDLGGGSLELAIGDSGNVYWETTLPLGVVRLHRQHARGELDCDVEAVRARVAEVLAPVRDSIRSLAPVRCIATGGTARAVARLLAARDASRRHEICGLLISRLWLALLRDELAAASHEERLDMPGMNAERVDLLPAGAAILESVLAQLDLPDLIVCDWGLREGVLLSAMRDARRHRREIYSLASSGASDDALADDALAD